MRLPRRAPIPPINLQKSPKTPRVQICRVVIKEQFSEAFDGVHYRKLFAAPATEAADRLLRERTHPIVVTAAPAKVHPHVEAIGPTQVRKRLRKHRDARPRHGIVFVKPHEHADAPYPLRLLRAPRDRPRRRAAEDRDELASLHSITSSARASSVSGRLMPNAFAA